MGNTSYVIYQRKDGGGAPQHQHVTEERHLEPGDGRPKHCLLEETINEAREEEFQKWWEQIEALPEDLDDLRSIQQEDAKGLINLGKCCDNCANLSYEKADATGHNRQSEDRPKLRGLTKSFESCQDLDTTHGRRKRSRTISGVVKVQQDNASAIFEELLRELNSLKALETSLAQEIGDIRQEGLLHSSGGIENVTMDSSCHRNNDEMYSSWSSGNQMNTETNDASENSQQNQQKSIGTVGVEIVTQQMEQPELISVEDTPSTGEVGRIEEGWLFIKPEMNLEDVNGSGTLTVSRVSVELNETGPSMPNSTYTRQVINTTSKQLARSFLSGFDFFGFFTGSSKAKGSSDQLENPHHGAKDDIDDDMSIIRSKVIELESQVLQMESLREHVSQLTKILEEMRRKGITPTIDLPTLGSPTNPLSHSAPSFVPSSAPPPSITIPTPLPPPPPPPALSIPPPPPPPRAGQALTISKQREEEREMTTEELQRAIKQQIECSDITASNVDVAVQNYIKCFSKHKQKLDKLVRVYPFLIKKLPLKPKSAYMRMCVWELNLFEHILDEKQARSWRTKKAFEIEKLETKEEILAEIEKIKKSIKIAEEKAKEARAQEERKNAMNNLVHELQQSFMLTHQQEYTQKAQEELKQLEEDSLDLEEEEN